jgi:hypothetical protein
VAGLRLIADAVSDVDEANALSYHTGDVQSKKRCLQTCVGATLINLS